MNDDKCTKQHKEKSDLEILEDITNGSFVLGKNGIKSLRKICKKSKDKQEVKSASISDEEKDNLEISRDIASGIFELGTRISKYNEREIAILAMRGSFMLGKKGVKALREKKREEKEAKLITISDEEKEAWRKEVKEIEKFDKEIK